MKITLHFTIDHLLLFNLITQHNKFIDDQYVPQKYSL